MNSISNQILGSILVTVIIVFGGWGYFQIQNTIKYEAERIEKNHIQVADRLAFNLSHPVWNINTPDINRVIHNEALNEHILSIRVFDEYNQIYAGTIRKNGEIGDIPNEPYYQVYNIKEASVVRPILHDKKTIGKVAVYPNKEPLQVLIRKLSTDLILKTTILIIALAGIQFFILRKVVIKPLSKFTDWAASVSPEKKLEPPHLRHSDEINSLISSFTNMTNRLMTSLDEISDKNKQLTESESRIKSISDNFTSGMIFRLIIKKDGTRKFTYLSDSVEKLYGITPAEGIANPSLIYDRIHPDDLDAFVKAEEEAMKNPTSFRFEARMRNPAGNYRWSTIVSSATPRHDGSVFWDGIDFDITEIKEAEAELQSSQFLLQSILEGTQDAVFVKDSMGRYLVVNSAAAKFAGKDKSEIIGKDDTALFPKEEAVFLMDMDRAIMASGRTQTSEEYLTTAEGPRTFLAIKGPLTDSQGRTIGTFGISRDITDRKKVEEALRVSQQKFAIAFHSSPDAVIISDLETATIIEVNNSFTNIFGYEREEALGKTTLGLNLFRNPEDRQTIYNYIVQGKKIDSMEVAGVSKSGQVLTVVLTVEKSEIDGKASLITNVHNITERKKMEEELRISQQKFEIAFNSSPNAIIISEQETGIIIETNAAMEDIFGYSREEVIGRSKEDLNIYKAPEDRKLDIEILQQYGFIRNREVVRRHKSGSDVIISLSVELSVINGKACYISTIQDITEQKRAEELLRESEERFKSIVSVSNTGAWEYHGDTEYLWCSPEYFSMLGRNIENYDMSGKPNLVETWTDLIHPDDREAAVSFFKEYLDNGSVGTYDSHFRMRHANGSWKWIWSRGQTLRDANGNLTPLTVGTHIDVTERKLAEMELQKLNLDKDRFISILGHDLRTPFSGILGILELLNADFDSMQASEIEELISMGYKSAKNASELLDDVLMWAMAQSGKMNFNPQIINFKEDCSHIIEMLHATAEKKNISVEVLSADDISVYADKNMLDTILRNLLSNALKFTKEGGKIKISSEKKQDNIIISVADNGVGIDPKDARKIFDKTQLFSSAGTANEKGTGFGLKLCQEFTERHGGKIWVESELGNGATFYFSLPDNPTTI